MLHREWIWGYPIALETVTLIYNKNLVIDSPPADLAQLVSISREMKIRNPGVIPILWDFKSAFYSWGILASAGAYVFAKTGADYDLHNVGIANRGAIEGLSEGFRTPASTKLVSSLEAIRAGCSLLIGYNPNVISFCYF